MRPYFLLYNDFYLFFKYFFHDYETSYQFPTAVVPICIKRGEWISCIWSVFRVDEINILVIDIFDDRVVSFLLLGEEIINYYIIPFVQEFFKINKFSILILSCLKISSDKKVNYLLIICPTLSHTTNLFLDFFLTEEYIILG